MKTFFDCSCLKVTQSWWKTFRVTLTCITDAFRVAVQGVHHYGDSDVSWDLLNHGSLWTVKAYLMHINA